MAMSTPVASSEWYYRKG